MHDGVGAPQSYAGDPQSYAGRLCMSSEQYLQSSRRIQHNQVATDVQLIEDSVLSVYRLKGLVEVNASSNKILSELDSLTESLKTLLSRQRASVQR